MKRWAAVLGLLPVLCSLAACSGSAAGTSSASPRSFTSEADQVVADLAAGTYTAVQAKFDPAMMQASQIVPLPKAWAACQHYLGTYRGHGMPVFACKGQFDNEQVSVTWGNGPGGHRNLRARRDYRRAALLRPAVAKQEDGPRRAC